MQINKTGNKRFLPSIIDLTITQKTTKNLSKNYVYHAKLSLQTNWIGCVNSSKISHCEKVA